MGVYRHAFRRPAPRRAFILSRALTKYMKLMTHPDAQAAVSVAGAVFAAPGGSDLTGAKIGEFSGRSFSPTLESGQAVLKVPVSVFGGGSLTVVDTPVCVFTAVSDAASPLGNGVAFGSAGVHSCTVIEE